jgi:hypothetical protein
MASESLRDTGPKEPGDLGARPYKQAVEWFRKANPIADAELAAIEAAATRVALAIKHAKALTLLKALWKSIADAIGARTDYRDWAKGLPNELKGALSKANAEAIVRGGVMQSYNDAKKTVAASPPAVDTRPYGLVSTIADNRRSALCTSRANRIYPLDHPFFDSMPPWHANCRTTIIQITAEQAGKLKDPRQDETERDVLPIDKGWGNGTTTWQPSKADTPAEIFKAYEKAISET